MSSDSHTRTTTSASLPRRPPPIPPPRSNRRLTVTLLGFVSLAFAFPFAYISYHRNKNPSPLNEAVRKSSYQSAEPLPPSAMIRGAYLNSGSKDIGYDDEYYKKHGAAIRALNERDDK